MILADIIARVLCCVVFTRLQAVVYKCVSQKCYRTVLVHEFMVAIFGVMSLPIFSVLNAYVRKSSRSVLGSSSLQKQLLKF